ncbi:helix-turn-helix domain-containing protein [Streptomyces sp. NPDC049097]|uniref:helix-turn-helix domain-containing protein n=1 Tax=Streptomyces sp. NPDC049097 TaxID=3155497 RepID=UPI0034206481
MSTEAVTWAMDDAPMLRTGKGRPDSTARHVLQVLAEHARADGSNAHPSIIRIQYRTGYDEATVRRALQRLEKARLIVATGTVHGRTKWRLALSLKRPEFDLAELEAEAEEKRRAAAERQRRSRARRVTDSAPVTVTDSESVTKGGVTHPESVSHALEVRDVTHSESARHTQRLRDTERSPAETSEKPEPVTTISNHQEPLPGQAVPSGTAASTTPGDEPSSDHADPITSQTIVGEWLDRCTRRPPSSVIGQVGKQVKALLEDDLDPDDIRRGIAQWMTRGLHPATLPAVVNEVMNSQAAVPAGRGRPTYQDPADRGIF